MDPELEKIGIGFFSAVAGAVIGFLGIKTKVKSIEQKIGTKVDEKVCLVIKTGVNTRIDDLNSTINSRFDTLEGLITGKRYVSK